MKTIPIAYHLQHYLSPSMTFIYRQLKIVEKQFPTIVTCSDRLENLNKFPFPAVYFKNRNFLRLKKSKYYRKLFGDLNLLACNPKLSLQQKNFLKKIYNEKGIRLIHSHFGPSGLEILPLTKQLRIPLVVTFHGYDASILLNNELYIKNLKKLFSYAHIVTVSYQMKKELKNIVTNNDNFSVIRCGIPVDLFSFVKREDLSRKFYRNESITFLQISNFVEVKGHKFTVEAFRKFLDFYKNAKLVLAGDGNTKESINNLCAALGIQDKVFFPGLVNEKEVKKLLEEADVFLHHSVGLQNGVKEGLPTVIMEAMATGLPVISSYHSAIPELIEDGINGFLVEERNIDQYYKAMLNLKNTPATMGISARKQIIENFNLEHESKKLMNLYYSLVN